MKFAVATQETQGQRNNDFQFCFEGEIVFPGLTCSNGYADDECGCSRSLGGLLSRKAGTTFKVVEIPDQYEDKLVHLVMTSEKDAGWSGSEEYARARVQQANSELSSFPADSIVEFRDGEFGKRN